MTRSMNHDSDANIMHALRCEAGHDFEDGTCTRCGAEPECYCDDDDVLDGYADCPAHPAH